MNEIDGIIRSFSDDSTARTFTDSDKYKVQAILAYILPFLFFVPFVCDRNSDFCKFHTNQSLAWLICSAVIGLVIAILGWIPLVGVLVKFVLYLAWVLLTACLVYGVIKNYAVKLPVIGDFVNFF